jgi:hypothetical protein
MFTLKRFFAYSVALHITFFILALTLISPVKNKKREEFFAKIISPEELLTPAPPIPAIPEIKPFLPSKPGGATSKLHIKPGSISNPPGKADTQTSSEQGHSYSQTPSSPAYPGQKRKHT